MKALLPKKAYLDKLAGALVRSRGVCAKCGKCQDLTWGHIISRNCLRLRWRTDNALCLCLDCHRYYDQTAEGKLEWPDFVTSVIGERKYNELKAASSYDWHTFERVDYGEILYDLNQEKKRLRIQF